MRCNNMQTSLILPTYICFGSLVYPSPAVSALLQQAPSMELINQEVVSKIAEEWHPVGMYCGITYDYLGVIKTNSNVLNNSERCSQMLERWLRKAPGTGGKPRMWDTLLNAVEMGHGAQTREDIQTSLLKAIEQATRDKVRIHEHYGASIRHYGVWVYSLLHDCLSKLCIALS